MTGYQAAGDEVRADSGQPKAGSAMDGAQFRQPFTPPEPLGNPAPDGQHQQERPELPEKESPGKPSRDPWTVHVRVEGPAYGGAAWNGGGGPLAGAIGGGRKAIESGARKVIRGIAEHVL
jgi:hypothetical protein